MKKETEQLKKQIKWMMLFFMTALIISGATAIPVEWELSTFLSDNPADTALSKLLHHVLEAVRETNYKFPFLMYGYDWLAFAHFVIAVVFIGVIKDPVRNIWVIEFGTIACLMIIPFAFLFSAIRGLPVWWSVIDSSFGIFGILPLWWTRKKILLLEKLQAEDKLNTFF
ncbi:MAG: hypothetical protein V4615_02730 [Bacteroidota bacterium]